MSDAGARILDGKSLAKRREVELRNRVAELRSKFGKDPALVVIRVGDDPASEIYVRRKREACARVGIESREYHLPSSTTQHELVGLIDELNRDADTNGILVQLPLPKGFDVDKVLRTVSPTKDVDAFHPENVGQCLLGQERMAPCTPQGILQLLDDAKIDVYGQHVVIVNHSNIVGKPLAVMLMNRDATVTVCHKATKDLASHTRTADIVVSGTGVANLLTADMIRPGAVVVDVSMVRDKAGKLCGDAAPDVAQKAAWLSPVPGGVGPMTISVLLANTVRSFETKMGLHPAP